MSVAKILDIDEKEAIKSLNDFFGTWRRFEYKGETKKRRYCLRRLRASSDRDKSDTERGERIFRQQKIWCVFHRTFTAGLNCFLKDFGKSFGDADEIILTDIYAARELKDESINSKMLAEEIIKNGGEAVLYEIF